MATTSQWCRRRSRIAVARTSSPKPGPIPSGVQSPQLLTRQTGLAPLSHVTASLAPSLRFTGKEGVEREVGLAEMGMREAVPWPKDARYDSRD